MLDRARFTSGGNRGRRHRRRGADRGRRRIGWRLRQDIDQRLPLAAMGEARPVGRHKQTFRETLANFLGREWAENDSSKVNFDVRCLLVSGSFRDILVNCIERTHWRRATLN
jgi:hypothetical protein